MPEHVRVSGRTQIAAYRPNPRKKAGSEDSAQTPVESAAAINESAPRNCLGAKKVINCLDVLSKQWWNANTTALSFAGSVLSTFTILKS